MQTLKDRSELLFVFDATDINPNGDPLNENKPRMDEESGHCLITDVRLKRTIRDYLATHKGLEIFVREVRKDDGTLQTKDEIVAADYANNPDAILERCIDIRLFGATLAIGGKKKKQAKKAKAKTSTDEDANDDDESSQDQKPITYTGPVQFRMGRSLHRVGEPKFHQGNTVMPSREGITRGTFRDDYLLPYGLFGFYGVINQKAGETTKLREDDIPLLLDAMWNGTKNLITRSKVGQMPRLLVQVIYNQPHYLMGELDKRIEIIGRDNKKEEELRDVSDLSLDVTSLVNSLKAQKSRIKSVKVAVDSRLKLVLEGKEIFAQVAFNELSYEPLNL